jgi:hypothetical protein
LRRSYSSLCPLLMLFHIQPTSQVVTGQAEATVDGDTTE